MFSQLIVCIWLTLWHTAGYVIIYKAFLICKQCTLKIQEGLLFIEHGQGGDGTLTNYFKK